MIFLGFFTQKAWRSMYVSKDLSPCLHCIYEKCPKKNNSVDVLDFIGNIFVLKLHLIYLQWIFMFLLMYLLKIVFLLMLYGVLHGDSHNSQWKSNIFSYASKPLEWMFILVLIFILAVLRICNSDFVSLTFSFFPLAGCLVTQVHSDVPLPTLSNCREKQKGHCEWN
jgi:amino acid permease